MTPSRPAAAPAMWLAVIPAALAGLILFDALLAIGVALDWALLGLYGIPQSIILAVGIGIAVVSFAVSLKFALMAYRAELMLE